MTHWRVTVGGATEQGMRGTGVAALERRDDHQHQHYWETLGYAIVYFSDMAGKPEYMMWLLQEMLRRYRTGGSI